MQLGLKKRAGEPSADACAAQPRLRVATTCSSTVRQSNPQAVLANVVDGIRKRTHDNVSCCANRTLSGNQYGSGAGRVAACDVGFAVADHPGAAEIEIEPGGGDEQVVGSRLAVERSAGEVCDAPQGVAIGVEGIIQTGPQPPPTRR